MAAFGAQIADIWSCGVLLYIMLMGAYPFERPEDRHHSQKVQRMIQVRDLAAGEVKSRFSPLSDLVHM